MRQNSLVLMVSYSSEPEKLYYVTLFNIMKLNEKEKKNENFTMLQENCKDFKKGPIKNFKTLINTL